MKSPLPLLSSLPLISASLSPLSSTLYATHYSGSVYTLSLSRAPNGSFSLTQSASVPGCGAMPSWLTLDRSQNTIYCSDETGDPKTNGSLHALSIQKDSSLKESASTSAVPGGGVNSVVYSGSNREKQYLAIAHYGGAALSTFSIPLDSQKEEQPLQAMHYHLTKPAPNPQQDTPHPHQVITDPKGEFILASDLGADMVRVYSIDKGTGNLTSCPSLSFTPGAGPRHAVFWTGPHHSQSNSRTQSPLSAAHPILYVVNELNGHLNSYETSYTNDCLSFKHIQSLVPYTNGSLPDGATLSEIRIAETQSGKSKMYISIRSDYAFAKGTQDSIATLSLSPEGKVSFDGLTSSGGTVPRTMVINGAGDLVAVGNQASAKVVVLARDVRSGRLGGQVASLQVDEPGKVGTSTGLSSVIWGAVSE